VNPLAVVIIAGLLAHTIVGTITRTPDDHHTPLHWKAAHSLLAGAVAGLATAGAAVVLWAGMGVLVPYWALYAAADLVSIGGRLWRHRERLRERRTLEALYEQSAFGEGM
jgi:hypothetical protein